MVGLVVSVCLKGRKRGQVSKRSKIKNVFSLVNRALRLNFNSLHF